MTDEKDRAVVIAQQVLEQFQGIDVEIVRRFVQDQHVGGSCEQARQKQTVSFSAGQGPHRRSSAGW